MDDDWSAGHVGLYRYPGGSAVQQYDDVKIGYDNNGDGDILDAGDDIQVLDPFTSNQMSLTYDHNGSLTDDGVLRYVYDAWNRLRKASRYADGDTTMIAEYKYLGDTRRASKVVQKCGVEHVANDGGNTTVHFYYGSRSPDREGGVAWSIFETRNGSNQSTRQWLWGTQYIDEPVCMDVNSSPTHSSDCDPDTSDPGGGTDRRYFYQQDRNFNVMLLLETDDGAGTAGRLAERYAYTPYGEFVVLKGETSSGNLGNILPTSTVGNPFAHQGLPYDQEKGSYHNRWREFAGARFAQHDPRADRAIPVLDTTSGEDLISIEPVAQQTIFVLPTAVVAVDDRELTSLHLYVGARPTIARDPSGLADDECGDCFNSNVCGPCGRANLGALCTRDGWKTCRRWIPCFNTCGGIQTCRWTYVCKQDPLTGVIRWRVQSTADAPCM